MSISIGNGKQKKLGEYDTARQAAEAYEKEAIKLRKPFSSLNYPKKAPVGYTPIQKTLYSNKAVGYRGVYKNRKKFKASIVVGGKQQHIGTFDTAIAAAVAYDNAAINAGRKQHTLNFPHNYIFLKNNTTKFKNYTVKIVSSKSEI